MTQHQKRARKLRTALESTAVATMIMLFFALCGRWVLAYLNIYEAAFRIAGGIILFLVALDMLSASVRSARLTTKRASRTMSPSSRLPRLFWPAPRPSCQ